MIEYEVTRSAGTCSVSGRPIVEGEIFYTALFETAEGFERRDFSEQAWQGPPEGALCFFKTRMPKKQEARRTFVDDDVLLNFFQRLENTDDPSRQRFRFVLSLILLRKRLLKYERTLREGGAEYWEMRQMRDKTTHRILNPVLTDEEIHELTGQLGSILAGYVPEDEADDSSERASEASASVDVATAPIDGTADERQRGE